MGAQIFQLCAPRSAPPGGRDLRQIGGSASVLPDLRRLLSAMLLAGRSRRLAAGGGSSGGGKTGAAANSRCVRPPTALGSAQSPASRSRKRFSARVAGWPGSVPRDRRGRLRCSDVRALAPWLSMPADRSTRRVWAGGCHLLAAYLSGHGSMLNGNALS